MPTVKALAQMEKSERDDFAEVLARWHQNPADYEVTCTEHIPPGEGGPIQATVKVRRVSTGLEAEFRAGNVSHWVIDFEHALRAKAFG